MPRQLPFIRWASANHHCSCKVIAGAAPCEEMVALWQGHGGVKMRSICQVLPRTSGGSVMKLVN